MQLPTLQELLEAGVHFGHDPSRWNPKMAPFIFSTRNRVHILDLQKTLEHLERAAAFVRDLAARGGTLLFVGTKRQARAIVKAEAERCGMPYVTVRWLGGTFTNFPTILKSIEKRSVLAAKLASPDAALMTKKDRQKMGKDVERIDTVLEGLRMLRKVPDAVFLVGAHDEKLAAKEAARMKIPVVAVADTNADPAVVAYLIPANDDAVRAIQLVTKTIADAVLEGRKSAVTGQPSEAAPVPAAPAPEAGDREPRRGQGPTGLDGPEAGVAPVRAGEESPML